jgi:ParB-like chromosome segregation protein Spo0J
MVGLTKKPVAASGPPLTVVWRRVETLRPDPANPRFHSPKQIGQLARSIAAFGFNVPILVDRGLRVITGHGRLLAAQELGLREVPTILLDHLNEARTRAFMIADNRLAENASWNGPLVVEQLKQISLAEPDFAIETTGFELDEIEFGTVSSTARPRRRPPRPDAVKPLRQALPSVCRDGDWWLLGSHRVGCGKLGDAVAEMLSAREDAVVVLAAEPAAADAVIRGWQGRTGGIARQAESGRDFGESRTPVTDEPDHG